MDRGFAKELDQDDPLAKYRRRFVIGDPNIVYLDGNSLGRMPKATRRRLHQVIDDEWAQGLIRSWGGKANWIDLDRRIGAKLAKIVGAQEDEALVCNSTTVNLYNLASATLTLGHTAIITNKSNFPTDSYVLQGLAQEKGLDLIAIENDPIQGPTVKEVEQAIKQLKPGQTPLVSFPIVCYRSGAIADTKAIDEVVEEACGITIWDGCHASGVVPLDGKLMVSCTYKYLNGGPGAPAFMVVPRKLQERLKPVIQGWMGQKNQFDMDWQYQPVPDVKRWASGTPSILSVAAIEPGADMILEAGVDQIRQKSMMLTHFTIQLYNNHLRSEGFTLGTPEDPTRRGGHVALCHDEAYRICKAMIHEGAIPDFRPPNIIRIGLTPLDTRYVDAYDGMDILREVMRTEKYRRLTKERSRVT